MIDNMVLGFYDANNLTSNNAIIYDYGIGGARFDVLNHLNAIININFISKNLGFLYNSVFSE